MNLLLFLCRVSRRTVLLAAAAAFLSGLSAAAALVVLRWCLIQPESSTPALVWAFVGICLGAVLAKLISQVLLIALSRQAVSRLVIQISQGILDVPLSHLEDLGPTRFQTTLIQDVQTLALGLTAVPLFCANAAIVAACLGVLGYLSVPVLLAAGGCLGIGLLIQTALMIRARRRLSQTREGQDTVAAQMRHLIEGVKELKTHRDRRQAFFTEMLQESVDHQEREGAAGQYYLALIDLIGRVVLYALVGGLLFGLPAAMTVSRAELGGYVLIVFFLMQPLSTLKFLWPQLDRARMALDRALGLGMDLSASAEEGANAPTPPITGFKTLELAGVCYSYRPERDEPGFGLGPLDLTFHPGELVFVGGGNGSGKTTFAKLVTGLYSPKKGEIRLDGRPVTQDRLEEYRQLFSIVFAEFHLFPTLLGLDAQAQADRAARYLTRLHLARQVSIRNGVFSSTTRLSRGQRKRLALLVAYLEDRPFYVFDEWAADQDPQFKDVFYKELLPDLKARGKTVLVITHDDRYFHLADRVVMLENGRLRPASAMEAHSAEETAQDPA